MKKKRMKLLLVSTVLFMAFCINPVHAGVFQYRSINFCSWGPGGFDSEKVDEALNAIQTLGVNVVALDWVIPFDPVSGARLSEFNDTDTIRTTSLADISLMMDKIRALGMSVVLKPHTTLSTTGNNLNIWEFDSSQLDKGRFFNDYKAYMIEVAQLSAVKGCPFLVIGTENNVAIGDDYLHYWIDMINTIRTVYGGQITYDALVNLWEPAPDIGDVSFAGLLDFISASVYPHLTQEAKLRMKNSSRDGILIVMVVTGLIIFLTFM